GRNFANKIWNAFRLVKGWEVADIPTTAAQREADRWFANRFNQTLAEIDDHFTHYRISDALMASYKLIWDDFCAWYLELVKPAYQQPIAKTAYEATKSYFAELLKLIHPFMPFISEELWHDELFGQRDEFDCCIVAPYPKGGDHDGRVLDAFATVQQVISEIRNVRNAKQLSPKTPLPLLINKRSDIDYVQYAECIQKMANVSSIGFAEQKPAGTTSFLV